LCAHETYMDCPYYEQLQYGGDARIRMLVSLYTAGDASLARNGIALSTCAPGPPLTVISGNAVVSYPWSSSSEAFVLAGMRSGSRPLRKPSAADASVDWRTFAKRRASAWRRIWAS